MAGTWKIMAAAVFVTLLPGCASLVRVEGVKSPGQQVVYKDGTQVVLSQKSTVVAVQPLNNTWNSNEHPRFVVSVTNRTPSPLDIDVTSVSANYRGENVKIYTYEEVTAEIKRKQSLRAFAVALGGAMRAYGASQAASTSYVSGSYSGNTYGSVNAYGSGGLAYGNYSANSYGTYSARVYDPAAGQAAATAVQAETNQQMESVRADAEAALGDARRSMMKRQTVMPGESYGGVVVLGEISAPEAHGDDLVLSVSFGGDEDKFKFHLTRER